MTEYGFIRDVRFVQYGSYLVGDVAIGAVTLQVEDASDFNEEGGTLTISGVNYAYNSADLDTDIITLAATLTAAYTDGEAVRPYPQLVEKHAVLLQEGSDEALTARVPHNLYDRLPTGMRDEGIGEAVAVELVDGEWIVQDILRRDVVIDGSYIDPSTLPIPTFPDIGPDGLAPSFSPTPSASGGIGSLFIKWNPITNHDAVTYEVHVSTSDGFTPSASTLVMTTLGSGANIRLLADGVTPITYGTTYFVKIIARDVDGPAPASNQSSASPLQVTAADISTNYVYAGQISVNNLTGGTLTADLTLAAAIKTADNGARVEMDASGIIIYKSDNTPATVLSTTGDSTFKGQVEAQGLTVTGGASFRSPNNEISQGGALRLATATTQSQQAPSIVFDWATTVLKDASGNAWPASNTLSGLSRTPDGKWLAADTAVAKFYKWNADGTFVSATDIAQSVNSVVQLASGGSYYGVHRINSQVWLDRLTETNLFSDSFTALTNWTVSGTGSTTIVSGKASMSTVASQNATITRTGLNMVTNGVSASVTPASDRDGTMTNYMRIAVDASNYVEMALVGTTLMTRGTTGGTAGVTTSHVYNSLAHAYWKITEQQGIWSFQTSTTGAAGSWNVLATRTHTFTATQLGSMTWTISQTHGAQIGNLIYNGDFDDPAKSMGWFTTSGTLTRDTTKFNSGSASMKVASTTSSFPGSTLYMSTTGYGNNYGFAVTGGKTYDMSFKWQLDRTLINSSNGGVYTNIQFRDATGAVLAAPTTYLVGYLNSNGVWQTYTQTVTAPANAAYAQMGFTSSYGSSGAIQHNYWIDDVSFIEQTSGTAKVSTVDDAAQFQGIVSVPFAASNSAQTPVIGASGTDLVVAEVNTFNSVYTKTISASNLTTQIASTTSTLTGFVGPLAAVNRGTFDVATDVFFIADKGTTGTGSSLVKAFAVATGNVQNNFAFDAITGGTVGMAWDGTNFYSLATTGALLKHEANMVWTTESASWKAGFTWADGSAHETPISTQASFTARKRARLVVTSPALPTGGTGMPDRIKVYVNRGTDTQQHYQVTTAAGVTTATLTSIDWSGAAPPLTTNFTSGQAATIVSTNNELEIKADGTAKVKGLIAYSDQDADITAGNRPALIIGDPAASHMRIDGDEIISMTNDTTQGTLSLNTGGTTQTSKLAIVGTNDATTSSYGSVGYVPPNLIVGSPTAAHLRIDNNEIIAMASDNGTTAVQGTLILNAAGGTRIGEGNVVKGFTRGTNTYTANASGDVTIAHGLSTTPIVALGTAGTGHQLQLTTLGATNIVFRVRTAAGVVVASGASIEVFWCAFL